MTLNELAELIASEINSKSKNISASVNNKGELVLQALRPGTKTGLDNFKITEIESAEQFSDGNFSGGETERKCVVIGNEGDTYFQRYDSVKTMPGESSTNQVVDIASVMLESHINLDGRTDLFRGTTKLTAIDWSRFGSLNRVYSQRDNYLTARELDEKLNLDTYPSSITWTLPKAASADIDEWTHITLASSLSLDGDKGKINAIRRFKNSLIAFQDKGIAEILFNSRTQLSTTDGVPVEIANSGKVDGKRYITNHYGCTNKWSIVEGKKALYFVDNVNKSFCSVSDAFDNISKRLGLSVWFKSKNNINPWTPEDKNNVLSFYDEVNTDVYLVSPDNTDGKYYTLVYNENLDAFTSFFDYVDVPMIVNVKDRLVAFKSGNLWLMHEGKYGIFFDDAIPHQFHMIFRITPDPLNDKIWTNIDYRADFYRILDSDGVKIDDEPSILGEDQSVYQPDETFDTVKVFNEYQETDNFASRAIKKFRIWRLDIGRDKNSKFKLDRIRNPWVNVFLGKTQTGEETQDLMQLHDVIVRYFE